jgi:acetyltransferase-like isoleucine patch superfamily enzyme
MATLIGDGGHARDIAKTYGPWRRIAHHSTFEDDGSYVVIGVNDPQLRAKIAAEIGLCDQPWVHPDAHLYVDVSYGYGTHINYAVSMTRTKIGNHCAISPGVTICGDVTIGDRCLIGAGATICDRVTIGDDVIVGAGAVVLPGRVIGSNQTVVGVPAKAYVFGHVRAWYDQ